MRLRVVLWCVASFFGLMGWVEWFLSAAPSLQSKIGLRVVGYMFSIQLSSIQTLSHQPFSFSLFIN